MHLPRERLPFATPQPGIRVVPIATARDDRAIRELQGDDGVRAATRTPLTMTTCSPRRPSSTHRRTARTATDGFQYRGHGYTLAVTPFRVHPANMGGILWPAPRERLTWGDACPRRQAQAGRPSARCSMNCSTSMRPGGLRGWRRSVRRIPRLSDHVAGCWRTTQSVRERAFSRRQRGRSARPVGARRPQLRRLHARSSARAGRHGQRVAGPAQ